MAEVLGKCHRTPLIPRCVVMALVVLVPLAGAKQDVLGQVADTPADCGGRPADACPPITLADSDLSRTPYADPIVSQVTVGTPKHSNTIEITPTRRISRYPLHLDGNSKSSCTPPESLAPADAGIILDSWFYYFSSLAQTIAAGSVLLVALAVIRLQALTNSLNAIERSVAEAFYHIGKQDDYRSQAFANFLDEQWTDYFNEIEELANRHQRSFATTGDYTQSKDFVESLVAQGRKFEARNRQLHRALTLAFCGTVLFAAAAILVLPAAQWISPSILSWSWAVSGILLVILFALYLRLVLGSIKSK